MEKLLISNKAELFRIDGGVGRAKISQNGGFSLKHKYLSGIVSYEADAVEKYHTAVTDFFVSRTCLNITCILNSYSAWASLPLIFFLFFSPPF
jgi:hypothetical protein